MLKYENILFSLIFGIFSVEARISPIQNESNMLIDSSSNASKEIVNVEFFYECLCPYSVDKYMNQLLPIVTRMKQYLHVDTNPYGNAKTIVNNGTITFECQHGPLECYGNKLHACAIDHIPHDYKYIDFNSCLLGKRSNDDAADSCGEALKLDAEAIKNCAKGPEGTQLLKTFGESSAVVNFKHVPYVLVNGVISKSQNLMDDICSAFKKKPDVCKNNH